MHARGKVCQTDSSRALAKESLQINKSANRLLIVSTNLDGYSLANDEWFAKFAKLFSCQTFPLYGRHL